MFTGEPDENLSSLAASTLGLETAGYDKIMIDLLPTSLIKLTDFSFPEEAKLELPNIMELYLVHNQSFLTDFVFLGFPFHYWYTAQFLLIMFVVLCVVYASSIEKANKKYNFIEET
jgi:putative solute:sodium symporter small subunit